MARNSDPTLSIRVSPWIVLATALLVPACDPATSTTPASAGKPAAIGGNTSGTAGMAAPATTPSQAGTLATNMLANNPMSMPSGTGLTELQPSAAPLPCDVGKLVSTKCQTCHSATPIGGAPMPLMSDADFSAMLKSVRTVPGETRVVADLVKMRINDSAMPMPPGGGLTSDELSTLNTWLDKGHPAGAAADAACAVTTQTMGPSGPVVNPDGTTCYQFRNHGQPMPGDTTPYGVVPGEHYVSFYYNAPWTTQQELVSWRTIYDNRKVLHHWLLYSTVGNDMDGTFAPSIGTHIGDDAELVAGWAVGGNDVHMPQDVALKLPDPGAGLLLEFHFYNTEPDVQMDSSVVEVCTVPKGSLKHSAGMTWLGTEDFNGPLGMPPKTKSEFSGTCAPSRAGMNDTDPIHIFTFWPHMHTYGRHMHSTVTRADGTTEDVFDEPFDFNYQITYDAAVDLYPGDTITSTCTFENTSDSNVAFGPSTTQEMCYQFTFAYPVEALDNGVLSLVGATNTCW